MDDRAKGSVERPGSSRLSPTVLLVEDEAAIRCMLARQLRAGGYRVISAASGREALEVLTEEAGAIDLLRLWGRRSETTSRTSSARGGSPRRANPLNRWDPC